MTTVDGRIVFGRADRSNESTWKQRRRYLLIPVSLALLPASPAWADDAPGVSAPAEQVEGTIVVTARKLSESIQKVPSSVRALGAEELEKLGANSIEQYAGQAPGLSI